MLPLHRRRPMSLPDLSPSRIEASLPHCPSSLTARYAGTSYITGPCDHRSGVSEMPLTWQVEMGDARLEWNIHVHVHCNPTVNSGIAEGLQLGEDVYCGYRWSMLQIILHYCRYR
ncbi:hypothetical protein BDM02DRAFT_2613312 [Thelephora ganbajun]|uniref:Uncharacterized protein n=1 Tax=Thelephora ganbajun TaxID=370292 RepID=A0ACB6ZSI6_THEGA|nr:hypothetical protein BDM02DRAFT_2613312 [Thelephora ganbajun]